MKKLLLFLSVLWFGLAQASAETYDVDKTDAVDVSPAAWGGGNTYDYDVTTSDGRATKMVEHYYGQLAENEDVPLKQTVTGLPNGNYTVTLIAKTNCANWSFDAPADFVDGSYDYAQVFACPGASYNPAKAQAKNIEADIARNYARAPQEYTIDVTVADGSLTLGLALLDKEKTNWHTIQIKSLIFHSEAPVTEPVNVTSVLGDNNATTWKRDNAGGNWGNQYLGTTDAWEQWIGAPGNLNNRIMYKTAQLPAGTYKVKASINALQQDANATTDQNVDFYVQAGTDVQKVNCYGDYAAREVEITLSDAAEVEIGIRAYAEGTVNWVAQKNLRVTTTSYKDIDEFNEAYAPLKLANAYAELETAYNNALNNLDEEGKAHFVEIATDIKSALDNKTYTTQEEITTAIGNIQTYLVESAFYVAGEDMTSLIVNAAIANGDGWTTPRTNSGQQYTGAPDNTYLDFWNNSGDITRTSQKITLPAGVYALLAATRSSVTEPGTIYAIANEVEYSTPIHTDGADGGQLGNGWAVTKVKDIQVTEESEVEIGFYCPTPNSTWAGADDFRLIKTGDIEVPSAEKVIFKWANTENADDYVAEAGTVECLGGDNNDRINYTNIALNVTYKTLCLNGKKGNLGDGTAAGTYIKVTPTQPLKAGDVISMTAYRNKNATGKKATAALIFDNEASTIIGADPQFPNLHADGEDPTGVPATITYTVTDAEAGAASFNMTRNDANTNLFITALVITTTSEEEPAATPDKITIDPTPGEISINSELGKLDQFTITFEDAAFVETDPNVAQMIVLEDEEGNMVSQQRNIYFSSFLGDNAAIVTMENGITTAGTYTLKIPAGLFKLDGKPCTANEATYIVTGESITPAGDKIEIQPAEGVVASLKDFVLVLDGMNDQVDVYGESKAKFYKNGEFVEEVTFDFNPDDWFDVNLYGSLSVEQTEKTTYTLEFPAGMMTRNGWTTSNTEPVVYTWEVGDVPVECGTYANPIALEDGKTYGLNFTESNSANFYTFISDTDVKVTLTPNEGAVMDAPMMVSTVNFYIDENLEATEDAEEVDAEYAPVGGNEEGEGDDDGFGMGLMSTSWIAKAGVQYYVVGVGNGTFSVALSEAEEIVYAGTIDNPVNLNEHPTWTWGTDGKVKGEESHYTFTAEKNGYLTITDEQETIYVGENGWYDPFTYTEGPKYTGEIVKTNDWDTWTATHKFAVEAGVTYCITIFLETGNYGEVIKAEFEEADAIKGAAADKANGTIYNIGGQKVDDNFRGIQIKNGKKVLKK